MDPKKQPQPASPLRVMSGLLSAKEQHCQRVADIGGLFETRLYRYQMNRTRGAIQVAEHQAAVIVCESDDVRMAIHAALLDGILTPAELAEIQRESCEFEAVASAHHIHLQQLAG